jgi:hypothetical protein
MKEKLFLWVGLLFCLAVQGQQNRTTRLFEYFPAPGQFINLPFLGTPEAALTTTIADNQVVSLGSFGGSITLGFSAPVYNHPDHPYGIDFTIFGNAFPGSSEPGIVWVMKDLNNNGFPDDTWYQIAGSEYFNPLTRKQYRLKWNRAGDGSAVWSDDENKSGTLLKNEFHLQPYYPEREIFSEYPTDSVVFEGPHLGIFALKSDDKTSLPPIAFGYADNRGMIRDVALTLPDNPYTPEIQEGCGGDPIDISWAVDSAGQYVDLDRIDFIRIATGSLLVTSQLGELSTEVGFAVASGQMPETTGAGEMVVIHSHPPEILEGDTLVLSAHFFRRGRITADPVEFQSANPESLEVTNAGKVTSGKGGIFSIKAFAITNPDMNAETRVVVLSPDSIALPGLPLNIIPGRTILLTPGLLDQFGSLISGMDWNIFVSDTSVLSIQKPENGFLLTALRPGNAELRIWTSRFPDKIRTARIIVPSASQSVRIYSLVKTEEANLLPMQWIDLKSNSGSTNSGAVEKKAAETIGYSLSDAVAAILTNAGARFEMRESVEPGIGLYLYFVEKDGIFTYGWGGKTTPAAYAKGWVIRKNGHSFLNNLDKTAVSTGDTILIYHVGNLLESWTLNLFTATPDSIEQGGLVEVTATVVMCTYHPADGIRETAPVPLENQPFCLGRNYCELTGKNGNAVIKIDTSLPAVISSGNDAMWIYDRISTGTDPPVLKDFQVYPNPAHDYIRIGGIAGNDTHLKIYDISGKPMLECILSNKHGICSVKDLVDGMYLIVIYDNKNVYRSKFIKK